MVPSRSGEMTSTAGASRIGCLLSLVVLVLAGYFAVLYAGSEIDYRQLQSEVQDRAAEAGDLDDQAIRQAIAARAAALQLPAAAGQATIRRFPGNRIQISISYPDALDFFGQWQWVRNRRIQVDQTY